MRILFKLAIIFLCVDSKSKLNFGDDQSDLDRSVEDLRSNVDNLNNKFANLKDILDDLKDELSRNKEAIKDLKPDVQQIEEAGESLKEEIAEQKQQIKGLKIELSKILHQEPRNYDSESQHKNSEVHQNKSQKNQSAHSRKIVFICVIVGGILIVCLVIYAVAQIGRYSSKKSKKRRQKTTGTRSTIFHDQNSIVN
ncbi:MAG: hypothetical protein MHPSP_002900 [Paramarteilia canceri]